MFVKVISNPSGFMNVHVLASFAFAAKSLALVSEVCFLPQLGDEGPVKVVESFARVSGEHALPRPA